MPVHVAKVFMTQFEGWLCLFFMQNYTYTSLYDVYIYICVDFLVSASRSCPVCNAEYIPTAWTSNMCKGPCRTMQNLLFVSLLLQDHAEPTGLNDVDEVPSVMR